MAVLRGAVFGFMLASPLLGVAQQVDSIASTSANISASIPPLVSVGQIQDVDLGTWSGSGNLQSDQQLCAWSSTRAYRITANSSVGTNNRFALQGPGNKTMQYSVFWDDGQSGFIELQSGNVAQGFIAPARDLQCSNNEHAVIRVAIDERQLQAATPGAYSDTLQLELAPE